MIREAIETFGPPGALPPRSQTGVNLTEEADAIVLTIMQLAIERDTLRREIETFAFKAYPDSFLSTDGGCTPSIIPDEQVQRVRELVGFSPEHPEQNRTD